MNRNIVSMGIAAALSVAGLNVNAQSGQTASSKSEASAISAKRAIDRGRYLAVVGGCNDCHTAGFGPRDGQVPESEWLMGSGPLGFRGPWGTTYAPNLRKTLANFTEVQWVAYARTLKTRPPMPWFNLNKWSDSDLRALYRYVRQMGPVGEAAQAYLPPDREPKPPFIQWPAAPK